MTKHNSTQGIIANNDSVDTDELDLAAFSEEWNDSLDTQTGSNGTVMTTNNNASDSSVEPTQEETNSAHFNHNATHSVDQHIDRPMILRAVEPDQIAKWLERHKDQLHIITIPDLEDD